MADIDRVCDHAVMYHALCTKEGKQSTPPPTIVSSLNDRHVVATVLQDLVKLSGASSLEAVTSGTSERPAYCVMLRLFYHESTLTTRALFGLHDKCSSDVNCLHIETSLYRCAHDGVACDVSGDAAAVLARHTYVDDRTVGAQLRQDIDGVRWRMFALLNHRLLAERS